MAVTLVSRYAADNYFAGLLLMAVGAYALTRTKIVVTSNKLMPKPPEPKKSV
jgi:hypothetical protein